MSYDLSFYKRKGTALAEQEIGDYLSARLSRPNAPGDEWFFENPDTEVYFLFDRSVPEDDPEFTALYENFTEYDHTHFSFNLSFMRPAFFGLEAFRFVEQFLTDLDLYVLNPQSGSETPYRPSATALFEEWNQANINAIIDHFSNTQSSYLPIYQSNQAWEYNYYRRQLQQEAGDNYAVPRIFFFKTRQDNHAFTLATWAEHSPTLIPPADYYLLTRQYKRLFRMIKDRVLVSRDQLHQSFGAYFDYFPFGDCRIIQPENAKRVKSKFNSIGGHYSLEDFAERVVIENLYNARP